MYKYIMVLLVSCVIALPVLGNASKHAKNLFVIVTTGDSVTQLMSMVLATQTLKKGANVEVLLCGEAGSLAVKASPEVRLKPNNKSPQMLLKDLVENGVTVEICPPYLPNNEKTASDLIAGVSVAKPPQVAEKLLRQDTKILSY